MDDETLAEAIGGAQRGEATAFDRLIDAYAPRLHGFLYRLTGSPQEAEDLVQEVFVRLVRTIAAYSHDGRFEPWLFRVAANLARDRIRRRRRAPTVISGDGEGDGDGGTILADISGRHTEVDAGMVHGEEVDALNAALGTLPEAEREVILLRHYSQMSFKEIATLMNVPLGTALARGHRGLAKLRKLMGADGASDGAAQREA